MIIHHFWTDVYVNHSSFVLKIDGVEVSSGDIGISNASNLRGHYSMSYYLSGQNNGKVISVITTEGTVSNQTFTILGD